MSHNNTQEAAKHDAIAVLIKDYGLNHAEASSLHESWLSMNSYFGPEISSKRIIAQCSILIIGLLSVYFSDYSVIRWGFYLFGIIVGVFTYFGFFFYRSEVAKLKKQYIVGDLIEIERLIKSPTYIETLDRLLMFRSCRVNILHSFQSWLATFGIGAVVYFHSVTLFMIYVWMCLDWIFTQMYTLKTIDNFLIGISRYHKAHSGDLLE